MSDDSDLDAIRQSIDYESWIRYFKSRPLAFEVAGYLGSTGAATIVDMAMSLERDPASIHRVLQDLMDEGLVNRTDKRQGKFVYYAMTEKNKEKWQGISLAFLPEIKDIPKFVMQAADNFLYRGLVDYCESRRLYLQRQATVHGQYLDHQFDFLITNGKKTALELINGGDYAPTTILNLGGRLVDIPSSALSSILIILLGHVPTPTMSYISKLDLPNRPKVEFKQIDADAKLLWNSKFLKKNVLEPVIKILDATF